MDGRFEKLFRFIETRVQAETMQKIVEKLFDAFAEEFFEFKIEFDEFIEDRWKPNYEPKNSFEEYNFKRNRILEEICEVSQSYNLMRLNTVIKFVMATK